MTFDAIGIDVGPEMLFAMDTVLVVLLVVAIAIGLGIRRKLTRLKSARDEWAREMAAFAVQAEAAESGFSRMRDALVAEASKQPAVEAAKQTPVVSERPPMVDNAEPVSAKQAADPLPPRAEPRQRRPGRAASIMSMQ